VINFRLNKTCAKLVTVKVDNILCSFLDFNYLPLYLNVSDCRNFPVVFCAIFSRRCVYFFHSISAPFHSLAISLPPIGVVPAQKVSKVSLVSAASVTYMRSLSSRSRSALCKWHPLFTHPPPALLAAGPRLNFVRPLGRRAISVNDGRHKCKKSQLLRAIK
jgi:hypothetical protein